MKLATIIVVAGSLSVCSVETSEGPSDEVLRERVTAALLSASDVPGSQITVEVSDGTVSLTGSAVCPECGGMSTPPGVGSVLQTIGSVVRAVPGMEEFEVELLLETEP